MKCAIYSRVSTSSQAKGYLKTLAMDDGTDYEEDTHSLKQQEELCTLYAHKQGWEVSLEHIYREVFSGYYLKERKVLNELIDAMLNKEFDVLLVYAQDRLARKTIHMHVVQYWAEQSGVIIASATDKIDNSLEGQIIGTITSMVAEMERTRIVDRTSRGRRKKLESGQLLLRGRMLYGYQWDENKKRLIHDPEAAPIVQRIFEEARNGLSGLRIAALLTKLGIPRPSGDGKPWTPATITRMVKNEMYKGISHHYTTTYDLDPETGKRTHKPTDPSTHVTLTDSVQPYVTAEEWAEANENMSSGNKPAWSTHTIDRGTLFNGPKQVVCGVCGCSFIRFTEKARKFRGGEWRIYEYPSYLHNAGAANFHSCKRSSIHATKIDPVVWDIMSRVLHDGEYIKQYLSNNEAALARVDRDISGLTDILNTRTKKYKKAASNLLMLDDLDDETLGMLKEQVAHLKKDLEGIKEELRGAEERRARLTSSDRSIEDILSVMNRFTQESLQNASLEVRRALVTLLDVQVQMFPVTHDRRWELTMNIERERLERLVVAFSDQRGEVREVLSVPDTSETSRSRCIERVRDTKTASLRVFVASDDILNYSITVA